MAEFKEFKSAMQQQFQNMVDNHELLFLTGVERDDLWEKYLDSFPEGTNEVYRERRAYDCQYCRQFIRPFGNVVAITPTLEIVTIWDFEIGGYYQEVANAMAEFVKSQAIVNVFVQKEMQLGIDCNYEQKQGEAVRTWHHFAFKLPQAHIVTGSKSEEAIMGEYRSTKDVFKRSLDEITMEAIDTVIELINQNSIYRGEEHLGTIEKFKTFKRAYLALPNEHKDNYCWSAFKGAQVASRIRNSAIGTLLVDVSDGRDLDSAVTAFERIMAPANYKRPKAIITQRMIQEAQAKVQELGFENSLGRRYAQMEDITVNNVLFADRNAQQQMTGNAFDELMKETGTNPKNFNKVEEIGIDDFLTKVLPSATSLEVFLEGRHQASLASLIAPQNAEAKTMFKWGNNFSWAYNGDVTDSIKEQVAAHGGKVDGVLRFSLSWDNDDDLDAHCIEPNGNRIFFSRKRSAQTRGELDVDIINPAEYRNSKKGIVENITWPSLSNMLEGTYKFIVHNYTRRGGNYPEGFRAEIEYNGETHEFEYSKQVRNGEEVLVAEVTLTKGQFSLKEKLPSTAATKEIWGINTNQFHRVSVVANSPNHWDGNKVGNRHTFFIIDGCTNDGTPRGFFNEFLNEELMQQKRVFEALGSKMRVEHSDRQLSGIGFSSTRKDNLIVKVTGTTTRILKVIN